MITGGFGMGSGMSLGLGLKLCLGSPPVAVEWLCSGSLGGTWNGIRNVTAFNCFFSSGSSSVISRAGVMYTAIQLGSSLGVMEEHRTRKTGEQNEQM